MKLTYLKPAGVKREIALVAASLNKERSKDMEKSLKWTEAIIDEAIETATDYTTIAMLKKIKAEIAETDKRLFQAQGQLDGLAWNHEEW